MGDLKDQRIAMLEETIREKDALLVQARDALDRFTKRKVSKDKSRAKLKEENEKLEALLQAGFQAAQETVKHFAGEPVPDSLVKFHGKCQKHFYLTEKIDPYK